MADQGFPQTHTTTTTTTMTISARPYLDVSYLRTLPGIVKVVQVVLDFICFICVVAGPYPGHGSAGWGTFVSIVAFIITLILLIMYLFHMIEMFHFVPWLLVEMLYCALWAFFYLIAASVLAASSTRDKAPAYGAFAEMVYCFIWTLFYLIASTVLFAAAVNFPSAAAYGVAGTVLILILGFIVFSMAILTDYFLVSLISASISVTTLACTVNAMDIGGNLSEESERMETLIEIKRPVNESLVGCYCEIQLDVIKKYKSIHQVISSFGDVLISPTEIQRQLLLIVPRETYFSPKWRQDVRNLGFKAVKESKVSDAMLETGMRFTLMTNVAPEWNRVGGALIQGNDFLANMSRRKYKRIEMNIHCNTSGQMYMKLRPDMVKLHPLDEWQVSTKHQLLEQSGWMKAGNYSVIPDHFRWSYVLPKLSRGQIVGIRQGLSEESGFHNYAELREFWWLTYGYSLPPTPPNFYYEIYFVRIPGSSPLLYPSCCVLSGEPGPIKGTSQPQKDVVLQAFLQITCRKMPTFCGIPLDLKLIPTTERIPKLIPLHVSSTPHKRTNNLQVTLLPPPS